MMPKRLFVRFFINLNSVFSALSFLASRTAGWIAFVVSRASSKGFAKNYFSGLCCGGFTHLAL